MHHNILMYRVKMDKFTLRFAKDLTDPVSVIKLLLFF